MAEPENKDIEPLEDQSPQPKSQVFPVVEPIYPRITRVNWTAIVLGTLAAIAVAVSGWALFLAPPIERTEKDQPRLSISASPTPSETPSLTPMPSSTPVPRVGGLSFVEPTHTPTPMPGGRVLVLTPDPRDAGWVVSEDESVVTIYDPQNHFGDSFLYAGVWDNKIYHAAFQFDLTRIPRGTQIYAANLTLTGLREDQLAEERGGEWCLQLLASDIDYSWRTANYQQIHNAAIQASFEPPLIQEQIKAGQVNMIEFAPQQLASLEQRLLEGSDQYGRKVSFRLDGPVAGDNNLFAWDSGFGLASQGVGPELFLSLGPPPLETPPPHYVVITSTPTPQDIATALADSLHLAAEAARLGTPTPLPPNWVTPVVVTATPTPENQVTAQWMRFLATATAVAGGPPPNMVTATPTPTYVIITSTPTPEEIAAAVANSLRMTAEAERVGTATPLPPNWVTPVVVTPTPTAANSATASYWQAAKLTTGTPTPNPANLQTATPTPTYVIITSTPTPQDIATALANSLGMTAEAERVGTATPLPPNWVTPVVVTTTPTPANSATVTYWQAVRLTTGTPTPTPANVQTATSTPIFELLNGELPTPAPNPTATFTPEFIPSGLVGKIAFLSDRAYHANAATELVEDDVALPLGKPLVYVIDPDGSNLALLTDRWPYDLALERDEFSANQRFRVFVKDVSHSKNGTGMMLPALYLFDFFDQAEQQITHFSGGIAYDPAWSPSRDQIAFVSNDSGNDEIWIINRDGSEVRQLTRDQYDWWDKHPSWSPDGSKIVFWSNRTGYRSIWVMDADGSNLRTLSRTEFNDWDPVWIK